MTFKTYSLKIKWINLHTKIGVLLILKQFINMYIVEYKLPNTHLVSQFENTFSVL